MRYPGRMAGELAICVVVAAHLASAAGPQIAGRVVEVHDGDTLTVQTSGGGLVRVRLEGIDCPELGAPFSRVARARTVELTLYRDVEVRGSVVDDHDRLVARVLVEGQDESKTLVSEGLAWHYVRYSSDPVLAAAERHARETPLGLWRDPHPMAPWDWRQAHRQAPLPEPGGPALPLHGNAQSHVYHRPGCPQYDCRQCTRVFRTEKDAMAAGYRPGGCCHQAK